jgi:hypothetical protein
MQRQLRLLLLRRQLLVLLLVLLQTLHSAVLPDATLVTSDGALLNSSIQEPPPAVQGCLL